MMEIGNTIPDVTLPDENGQEFSLRNATKEGPAVIYFYPKDDSPGCTVEACSFRDHFEDFKDVGATVYGISKDSPESHQKFKKRHRLNFTLLSDSKGKAEKVFDVPRNLFGLLPGRVTFIFDSDGKLVHRFSSATNMKKHIKESIKALKKL